MDVDSEGGPSSTGHPDADAMDGEGAPSSSGHPEGDAIIEEAEGSSVTLDERPVSPDCEQGADRSEPIVNESDAPASPMQQSPDQSNLSDRSPEPVQGIEDAVPMEEETAASPDAIEDDEVDMSGPEENNTREEADADSSIVTSAEDPSQEVEAEAEEREGVDEESGDVDAEPSSIDQSDKDENVLEDITSTSEQPEECDSQELDLVQGTASQSCERNIIDNSSEVEQGVGSSSIGNKETTGIGDYDLDCVSEDEASVKSDTEGCESNQNENVSLNRNEDINRNVSSASPDTSNRGSEMQELDSSCKVKGSPEMNVDSSGIKSDDPRETNSEAGEESDDELDLTSQDETDPPKEIDSAVVHDNTKDIDKVESSICGTDIKDEAVADAKSPQSSEVAQEDTEDKKEKESDARSEASLEEVSDEEDDMDDEEVEEKGGVGDGSGIEEVSDEEELDEEEEEAEKTTAINPDLEEGEHEPQSGVEEVSDESSAEEEEAASLEGDGECTDSEGMEDVSSEEEQEEEQEEEEEQEKAEEPEKDDNDTTGATAVSTRTVEVTETGGVVSIDDTGKDDGTIVQEILVNMTIKVDMVQNQTEGVAKELPSKKERSRDRKDRRDSSKSRGSMRDINERLKVQASYGEDLELDYDDIHDEAKDKQGSGEEGALSSGSESDDGEIEEEEDCEEGEIREPGSKPFVKPTCRFYMRGHCTWGTNCRFLHPGINDKGNYQLIERPGFNNKSQFEEQWEEEERSPSPEPPAPAPEPKEESSWERGLRQAKELRKKALERRELEPNFEQKKLNLSIDDNPEYNKENNLEKEERPPKKKKSTYYDKLEPLSDDEYYDQTPVRLQQKQQSEQSWEPGQYENFEVRWTSRDQYYMPPPHSHYPGPPPPHRYPPMYPPNHPAFAHGRGERFPPTRPSSRPYSPSPPPQSHPSRYVRAQRDPREVRREKMKPRPESPPLQKPLGPSPNNHHRAQRADEWHDPWTRSNIQRGKSPDKKRSRSRGRRRSRRSHSYSSSYSSSSYSGSSRSRSRSSSMSSISSRSRSRSRSSSFSSRSPSPRRNQMSDRRRPPPVPSPQENRRFPPQQRGPQRPGDQARSGMVHGHPNRSPDQRMPSSPMKGPKGHHPLAGPPGRGAPPGGRPGPQQEMGRRPDRSQAQQQSDQVRSGMMHGHPNRSPEKRPGMPPSPMKGPKGHHPLAGPPGRGMPPGGRPGGPGHQQEMGRRPDRSQVQQQRKFQLEIKPRDRQLPPSALTKEKMRRPRGRGGSSSTSRSRSRSSSSSSHSSRSSYSSSRSSSSSSSGSADSDHLYRNIGNRETQKPHRVADKPKMRSPPGEQRRPMGNKPVPKMGGLRQGEFGKAVSAQPPKAKDPLKMTGQKSNIKLTLIKPGEKGGGARPADSGGKKRPGDMLNDGPPQKRQSVANPVRMEKPMKKVEKAAPVMPMKAPGRAPGPVKQPPPAAPAPAPAAVKKKSTVSRREELLKQLKAVEDAIAKKKKKMN